MTEKARLTEADLDTIVLLSGNHADREKGLCVMEAVAYFAGEPHSDAPRCASPVLTAFAIRWNDGVPDDETRTRLLKPFITQLVGTRSTPEVDEQRSFMALDWLVRVHTPAWLDLRADCRPHASALRALPAVTDVAGFRAAVPVIEAARATAYASEQAARAAALNAALDGALDAAFNAALAAALDGALDAALNAALAAARAAALDGGWSAGYNAARKVLDPIVGAMFAPVVQQLQASAVDLFTRMIAHGRELLTK